MKVVNTCEDNGKKIFKAMQKYQKVDDLSLSQGFNNV